MDFYFYFNFINIFIFSNDFIITICITYYFSRRIPSSLGFCKILPVLPKSPFFSCVNCPWISAAAAAAAKSLQSCPTLCDPRDGSPPGSPVPGILQARTQEWVAISFSNAWKWKVKVKSLSRVWLLATPWTAAHQAPPSMGVSRQYRWLTGP